MNAPADFDRLARIYHALEWLAFGRDLGRARFCLLDRLAGCRSILVLGEGDGRVLARLVSVASAARIHCFDASPAMLARARARLAPADAARVTFTCGDARTAGFPPGAHDAVVTLFFLDCFAAAEVAALVSRIHAALRPGACWLFADFALPPRGFRRWRARIWLAGLYAFFRWETGLQARALPPSEASIRAAGFSLEAEEERQLGLLRTVLFRSGTRDAGGG